MCSTTIRLSLLLLLLTVSPVSADDESPWPEEYTILCSSEKRTGLNWVNGDWQPERYKNTQRLIVKSKSNKCGGDPTRLTFRLNVEDLVYTKPVCINERELGKKYIPEKSTYCVEYSENEVIQMQCQDPVIVLSLNGWYHYAYPNYDLSDSKDRQKESQYLEVGKCSMLKP